MKNNNFNVYPSPFNMRKSKAGKKDQQRVRTECHNFLTSDELAKFESVDVSDDPILEEYQSLFMEQVFSAAHDEDMVSCLPIAILLQNCCLEQILFAIRSQGFLHSRPWFPYFKQSA